MKSEKNSVKNSVEKIEVVKRKIDSEEKHRY